MNTDILFNANIETLKIIKDEAEKSLSSIQNADEVITNKSNNLSQILIPVILLIIGFNLDLLFKNQFDYKFYFSILIIANLAIVISLLYKNILPIKSAMSGSQPADLLQSDIVHGNEDDVRRLFINRIYNIQKAIEYSIANHNLRYKTFQKANKFLFFGIGIIFCLFLLLQVFLLSLNKC